MFNHDITLLGPKEVSGFDESDEAKYVRAETTTLAMEQEITRAEYYAASQAGLKPRYTILINPGEYHGEKLCRYKGETLSIQRDYFPVNVKGIDLRELQLVERIGDGSE